MPLAQVFFAGEATCRKYPATMHGAFITGLRTAANLAVSLQRLAGDLPCVPAPQPAPRVEAAAAAANGPKQAAPGPLPEGAVPAQPSSGSQPDASAGVAAAGEARGAKVAPVPPPPVLAKPLQRAAQLEALFADPQHPPDLEFGCFAAIHAPARSHHAGLSLLRVDLPAAAAPALGSGNNGSTALVSGSGARQAEAQQQQQQQQQQPQPGGQAPAGPVFLCVRQVVVAALSDVAGDDSRLVTLATLPEGHLAGRPGLSEQAGSLADELTDLRSQPAMGAGAGAQLRPRDLQ